MSDKNIEPKGSFWTTVPGCITAIGGLVSVVVAAVVALSAAGFIQPPFQATATPHVTTTVSNSSSSSIAGNVPSAPDTELPPAIPTRVPPTNTTAPAVEPTVIEFDNQGPLWDSNCNSIRQDMNPFGGHLWRERDQLFGAGLNCDLGFEINVPKTGYYRVTLYATQAPDFGRLRLVFTRGSVSDDVFNVDLYDTAVRPTAPFDLGIWHFTANEENHFILVMYGKNDASVDFKFGLDYMTLEHTQRGLP